MTSTHMALITSLFNVLVFYSFIKCVLKRKAEKPLDYLLIGVLYLVNVLPAIFIDNPVIKFIFVIILPIFLTMLIFKVSFKKSLLANLVYDAIFLSIEFLGILVACLVTGAENIAGLGIKASFITELICQFVIFVIVIILNTVFKKGILTNLDIKGWLIFALFPLFTIIAAVVLVFSYDKQSVEDVYGGMVVLASGMFILNILIFMLIDNVVRRESVIHDKEIMLEQTEHLNQMYRSLSDEREKQKARSHDYMNHLNVMLMLAHEGKIDEQIHYIEEQLGKEVQSVDIIDTGNTLINAVLNIKYLEAKEKGIIIPFIADNLKGIKISDSDLVTILTNVLDNAIEAVEKCDEKRIVFKIIKDYNTLIIDSTNPYKGKIKNEDNFLTTKNDKKNHGFGLANIKKTVEANNGNCFIDTEGGNFHISITLPLA